MGWSTAHRFFAQVDWTVFLHCLRRNSFSTIANERPFCFYHGGTTIWALSWLKVWLFSPLGVTISSVVFASCSCAFSVPSFTTKLKYTYTHPHIVIGCIGNVWVQLSSLPAILAPQVAILCPCLQHVLTLQSLKSRGFPCHLGLLCGLTTHVVTPPPTSLSLFYPSSFYTHTHTLTSNLYLKEFT